MVAVEPNMVTKFKAQKKMIAEFKIFVWRFFYRYAVTPRSPRATNAKPGRRGSGTCQLPPGPPSGEARWSPRGPEAGGGVDMVVDVLPIEIKRRYHVNDPLFLL